MKHYKSPKKIREAAIRYYYEHREEILAKYKTKSDGKCKICGKKLVNMPTRMYRFCNECMADKNKVSRQVRWYRRNSSRLKLKRKSQRRVKK